MSFFSEAVAALSLSETKLSGGYQMINFNGEAIYIEGFKRIVSLGTEEMILELKKGSIKVCGENLSVFSLEQTTIIIKGDIKTIEAVRL